ncbi:hypothetical protein HYDPIDRAFT_36619 [Hydnomerulius pinastri MD-312]|nr:hypothetical protein HYDPIDRAFT_36619 [Hydnomerulius pinastri MD-312]
MQARLRSVVPITDWFPARQLTDWMMLQQQLYNPALCIPTILAMNAFPNGTRVFFWTACGEIKYATVQSTSRLADGTQVVVVAIDGGEGHRNLPVSSVSKVQ